MIIYFLSAGRRAQGAGRRAQGAGRRAQGAEGRVRYGNFGTPLLKAAVSGFT
jgi:hypothetical protein